MSAGSESVSLALAEIPPGSATTVEAFGTTVAVFNVDGTVYAMDNTCPHHQGPLCRGRVGGTLLPSDPYEYRYGLDGRVGDTALERLAPQLALALHLREAEQERHARSPSHRRENQKPNACKTSRTIGDHYTTDSYRRAIERGLILPLSSGRHLRPQRAPGRSLARAQALSVAVEPSVARSLARARQLFCGSSSTALV